MDDNTTGSAAFAVKPFPLPGTNELSWQIGNYDGVGAQMIAQPYHTGDRGDFRVCIYQWDQAGGMTVFHNNRIGMGDAGGTWLTANLNGPAKSYLVNIFAESGENISMVYFYWDGASMSGPQGVEFQIDGSTIAWLAGPLDSSGAAQIIQLYENGNYLGIRTFGVSAATGLLVLNNDFDQLTTPVDDSNDKFVLADIDGDGGMEIVQIHNNGGYVWFYAYKIAGNTITVPINAAPNIKEGTPAMQWLAGDIDGDGSDEVVQVWNNGGNLALLVYKLANAAVTVIADTHTSSGQGNQALLIGNFDATKTSCQVAQLWDNNDGMGIYLYEYDATTGQMIANNYPNAGLQSSFMSFLVGNVMNATGPQQIFQQWDNGGELGIIAYGWQNSAMTTVWSGAPTD